MLFGAKTRPISDFLPRILAHIDGVDVDMAEAFTMDAVIQFLRDTKLMSEIICFDTEDCVSSYKLRTNNRITEVLSVRVFVNGWQYPTKDFPYYVEADTFYFTDDTSFLRNARVEVEVATAPFRSSGEVPEFIYEDWLDAIVAMTLSKLYMLTDNDWVNPQMAQIQLQQYQQLVRQARFSKITKHKAFSMRLGNKRRI